MSPGARPARLPDAAGLVAAMAFSAALGFEDWCPASARFVRAL